MFFNGNNVNDLCLTCFQRIRLSPLFVFTSILSVINTSDLLIKLTFLRKLAILPRKKRKNKVKISIKYLDLLVKIS